MQFLSSPAVFWLSGWARVVGSCPGLFFHINTDSGEGQEPCKKIIGLAMIPSSLLLRDFLAASLEAHFEHISDVYVAAWWHTPIIPILGKLRQEDCFEFELARDA